MVARIIGTIMSALTTVLVYSLTLKLFSKRAAIFAAVIHIFYPSFIAYSHYLWSETTFILLLLLSVYYAVSISDARTIRQKVRYAALSGLFLGLSGLTRAVALPYLFIIPLWLAYTLKESNLKICLTLILSWVMVILPWQASLAMAEKRFVPLSTSGGYNLYLGNNPWIPEGSGSSWGHAKSKESLGNAIKEYAHTNSLDADSAAQSLAIGEIGGDLNSFFIRCFYKFRMLWASDFFVMRHIFHAAYPPMPYAIACLIWIMVFISYVSFIAWAVRGFFVAGFRPQQKNLILIMVIAGMIPPVISVAMSRLHQPLLALLLPVVGHGAATKGHNTPRKRTLTLII